MKYGAEEPTVLQEYTVLTKNTVLRNAAKRAEETRCR